MGKVLKGIKTIVGVGGAIANMTTSNPADITPSQYAKLQNSTEIAERARTDKLEAQRKNTPPTAN